MSSLLVTGEIVVLVNEEKINRVHLKDLISLGAVAAGQRTYPNH
jgi:hypothetical protein